jgi:subtilisin family serine protease
VAAVDETLKRASFSNFNNRVLLAAPGVSVLSTVPRGSTAKAELTTALGTQTVVPMDNFPIPTAPVTGRIVNCGLAGTAADCAGAQGAICLIERGEYFFNEKALSCEAAGGIGAVVYNRADEAGPVYGTLGDTRVGIPIVGTDRATGISLLQAYLGTTATLAFSNWAYDYFSGTSMATPHVAGVAALVWSRYPKCSSETIRQALLATAQDLGVPGRDPDYGVGLVRARPANAWLSRQPCAAAP